MVQPKQAPRPEHSIDVKHHEMQQLRRNPVAHDVHRVHNIQGVVEERQPLRDADVERHHPSRRDEVVERAVEIHGGGDYGYVAVPHPHGERRHAAPDVETYSDGPRRLRGEDFVDGEVEVGGCMAGPAVLLAAVEVEAVLAVVEASLVAAAVDQA